MNVIEFILFYRSISILAPVKCACNTCSGNSLIAEYDLRNIFFFLFLAACNLLPLTATDFHIVFVISYVPMWIQHHYLAITLPHLAADRKERTRKKADIIQNLVDARYLKIIYKIIERSVDCSVGAHTRRLFIEQNMLVLLCSAQFFRAFADRMHGRNIFHMLCAIFLYFRTPSAVGCNERRRPALMSSTAAVTGSRKRAVQTLSLRVIINWDEPCF